MKLVLESDEGEAEPRHPSLPQIRPTTSTRYYYLLQLLSCSEPTSYFFSKTIPTEARTFSPLRDRSKVKEPGMEDGHRGKEEKSLVSEPPRQHVKSPSVASAIAWNPRILTRWDFPAVVVPAQQQWRLRSRPGAYCAQLLHRECDSTPYERTCR